MGREMHKIANRNEKLFTRLDGILETHSVDVANSRMTDIMIEYFNNTADDNIRLLTQGRTGFIEHYKR